MPLRQGFYRPKNEKKYLGDPRKIVYRSSWEYVVMKTLDKNPNVLAWSSEEIVIPYVSPLDNRVHRYFPDFYVKIINKNNTLEERILEIKPSREVIAPSPSKTRNKTSYSPRQKEKLIRESMTYAKNVAKWKAAQKFCEEKGWKFQILTEKELFANG